MTNPDIYQDISERTGGAIYIGITGPCRTGKSTFIRRFMEKSVLPNMSIQAEKDREVAQINAEKAVIEAEAKAEALRIAAEAEAEANRMIAGSLTGELIEKIKYEQWNGELPTVTGSSSIISIEP